MALANDCSAALVAVEAWAAEPKVLGRAAAGSMRDALSLTDQAIAFGSGALREADVRSMLGSVDLSFVYRLLEAVAAAQPGDMLEVVAQMNEHGVDFAGALDELLSLLHRVATAQAVPQAIDNHWGDGERVAQFAAGISAEDAQLFYQVALNGKRDLALAPEPRAGFEMTMLRMVAFRPQAVIDDSLGPDDLREVASAPAAAEGGAPVKKSVEPPPPPVAEAPREQGGKVAVKMACGRGGLHAWTREVHTTGVHVVCVCACASRQLTSCA